MSWAVTNAQSWLAMDSTGQLQPLWASLCGAMGASLPSLGDTPGYSLEPCQRVLNRNRPRVAHGEKEALPTSLAWTLGLLVWGGQQLWAGPLSGFVQGQPFPPLLPAPKGLLAP